MASLLTRPGRRRPVFRDPGHEQRFREQGFVVVPFLDEPAVAHLRSAFARLGDPGWGVYHHELWGRDEGRKRAVRAVLAPLIAPALDNVLVGYVSRTQAYIRKQPGEETRVAPHVDITFVDESRWRSVMLWCSLTGGQTGEGILHLVPGSHRLRGAAVRAHRDDASAFPELESEVRTRWGVPVEVGPGQAVLFDHAIVHFAEPNIGRRDQLV